MKAASIFHKKKIISACRYFPAIRKLSKEQRGRLRKFHRSAEILFLLKDQVKIAHGGRRPLESEPSLFARRLFISTLFVVAK